MVTSRRQVQALFIIGCACSLVLLSLYTSPQHVSAEDLRLLTCDEHLAELSSLGFRGLIIDINFMRKCEQNVPFTITQLKVAVLLNSSVELQPKTNTNKNVTINAIHYSNDPSKDYWSFLDGEVTKGVPRLPLRNISNFDIPVNVNLFSEYWSRSRMLTCEDIDMKRKETNRHLPIPYSFEQMALLRDLLVSYGMFPSLLGGSLLGWYRECSIIPHTLDIDFSVFAEQFNEQFENDVLANKTNFSLWRRLGMVNDGFEYTVRPKDNTAINMDMFCMYKEDEQYWVGETGGNGEKYRYYYPHFVANCSADLGGYLFWVTCDPDKMLQSDYGSDWRMDHPTSRYSWNSSGRNVKEADNGLRRCYLTYHDIINLL